MSEATRCCSRCEVEKPEGDFAWRDGPDTKRRGVCRECQNSKCRVRQRRRYALLASIPVTVLEKTCRTCKQVLPRDRFSKKPTTKDRLSDICHGCKSASERRRAALGFYDSRSLPTSRICTRCHVRKDSSEFYVNTVRRALYGKCKQCWNDKSNRNYARSCARPRPLPTHKRCGVCGLAKSATEFHADRDRRDGLTFRCKDCCTSQGREWAKRNPAKVKAAGRNSSQRARERRRGQPWNGPGVSDREWQEILQECRQRCLRCGRAECLELDHVIPSARGGYHGASNAQVLCARCNNWKKTRIIDYRYSML